MPLCSVCMLKFKYKQWSRGSAVGGGACVLD